MNVQHFFDPRTFTLTYVLWDPATRDAVVIDPVLDYDPVGSKTSTGSVEAVAAFVNGENLRVHWVLETHAHADHLSASQWLKRVFGAKIGIGAGIRLVQETFKGVFDASFATDGSQFDRLLEDGETLQAGALALRILSTPGHTPACLSFQIGDAVFTGDALFMEDYGVGRCDFPRGDADELYTSVHEKLYALPDATRVFVGHDYQPGGRAMRFETTIGRSKESNVHLRASTTREGFVTFRKARDATLAAPVLLFPSIQVNVDAGRLPPPHANGQRYFVVPVNLRRPTGDDGAPA